MKVFHWENGKEVVYVQLQDMMYLYESDVAILASVFQAVFSGTTLITDENRFDFVKFKEEREVDFFKELDFIIDFDEYKNLTDRELVKKIEELGDSLDEIAKKWNSMTIKERKKNGSLYSEYQNIEYMMNFLSEVYAVTHGMKKMPFPSFVNVPQRGREFSNAK